MLFSLGARRPSDRDAAVRLLVLKQLVIYGIVTPTMETVEAMGASWSQTDRRQFERDLEDLRREHWSKVGPWNRSLTPTERAFALATPFTMTERQRIDVSWRMEAFQVLLWALALIDEMPGHDTEADLELLKQFPTLDATAFVRSARLRPRAQIDHARDLAEFWHWRSRTRELVEQGRPFDTVASSFGSFDEVVRVAAEHGHENGDLASVSDGDFTVFGKAYRDLSPEEWATVRSISVERHFALNWLCGYAPSNRWDETPTNT